MCALNVRTLHTWLPQNPNIRTQQEPRAMTTEAPSDIDATVKLLETGNYVSDRSLATALHLALQLKRPLFLEGEAGVGKTEIAKVLSETLNRPLVRLQCYEGLDVSSAVYEWNYSLQMVEIRLSEAVGDRDRDAIADNLFSEKFLIKRPLLQALEPCQDGPPILLIDELDRTDEPFEAYLLEVLSDFQITIPEIGTIAADEPPIVIITSNRTREIHDALKRRCFYYWIDYLDAERELAILEVKAPSAPVDLSRQVVAFVQKLREMDLFKQPGVAETIDWAHALTQLDCMVLDPDTINNTLGTLLKYQDDIEKIRGSEASRILADIKGEMLIAGNRMIPISGDGGLIAANIMHFARVLRAAGLPIGPGKVIDAINAVSASGIGRRDDFYWTLHAVFVNRRDQRELFDQAFHVFWKNPQILERMMSMVLPRHNSAKKKHRRATCPPASPRH